MHSSIVFSAASLLGMITAATAVSSTYTYYTGDGSVADGWPSEDDWGTFEELWAANTEAMGESCANNGWGDDDSTTEIDDLQSAIESVATASGVDERFILAIVMQESEGCVRVQSTNNGVENNGLMQSHDGTGTCYGVDPCPASEITQMIEDGTEGTSSGDGIEQTLATAEAYLGVTTAQAVYAAARIYNSGSADYTNLDDGLGSTDCYASDVANRLTGWSETASASTCTA